VKPTLLPLAARIPLYNMNYFCNLSYFSKFLNLGVEIPEDGVNDAETCGGDIRL
jgi:hypothetical protein